MVKNNNIKRNRGLFFIFREEGQLKEKTLIRGFVVYYM